MELTHEFTVGVPVDEAAAGRSGAESVAEQRIAHPKSPAAPVDLVGTAGASVVRRAGPALALLLLVASLAARRR